MQSQYSITTMIVPIVVFVVVFATVLMPIIHATTTETTTIDEEMINTSPIGNLRLSYADAVIVDPNLSEEEQELPLSKSYTITKGESTVDITGDATASVPLSTNQIIFGTDTYFIAVYSGNLLIGANGTSSTATSVTVTLADNNINGMAYQYVYYPDNEGIFANFDTYEYEIKQGYAVGAFAKIGIISKGGEVSGDNIYDLTATVNRDGTDYTGVTYDKE